MKLPAKRIWALDEFGAHLAMSRAYARSPRGERAKVVERFEPGSKISSIAALTLQGIRAPMMIEGAIDGEVLSLYVEHFLVPELHPGDIVMWDKLSTHGNQRAIALIEATGAHVIPFPAYSPDFDPIEECISKVKSDLRRDKPDTELKLRNALKRAFARVTQKDSRGWFKDCGYNVTRT
ncbi:MAG: transposase [Acidobacteriota bacterium]|nr:MAG: transposase [Acidobacteriota bacterium]